MSVKVIRRTPDQLGYTDRGLMKWQGLMLSSHTEALKAIDKEEQKGKPKAKELMSEMKISEVLQQSYLAKRPVSIQANVLRNGDFYPDVNCIVVGFQEKTSTYY